MKWINDNWAWVLTIVIIFSAAIIFYFSSDVTRAAQIGDFFAGFAAALAFLWLINSFYLQKKELILQRQELKQQRESINLQREELHRIGKHSALSQIKSMLKFLDDTINSENIPGASTPAQLANYVTLVSEWKIILKSNSNEDIYDAFIRWKKIDNAANNLVSTVATAARLYLEITDDNDIVNSDNDAWFIYNNFEKLSKIPYLSSYLGYAWNVACDYLIMTEPGIKRVRLAGYEATDKLFPGVVKEEGLRKLREEVENLDKKE